MNIISCDDLFDFDLTWVNDSTQWPGAHQTSAKKKIARWFQNDEIIQGMVVDIGLHESVSTKLKSLVGREEEGGRGVQICRAIKNINNVLGLNGRLEPFIRCGGAPIPSTVCIWSPIRGREKDIKITFRRISGKKPNKGDNLLNAVTAGNGQEVPQRARKLVASYGRVFTNFYQNAGKSEEDRKRKNLKEQERRKRAKLAKAQPPLNVGQDSSNPTDPSIPGNSGADSSSI
ncbi:hypothetical protein RDWZM_005453 [Blomia tropicalis]|uniref:Uncharacterized protein n=1 Tax=Blomia tropicalis TaxID=40697 RepID=A0A9Q0RNG7_BLOTA|nr:hypothetical protein RDWZM_005453 [Blomia tropicalis]